MARLRAIAADEVRYAVIHGYRRAYRQAGAGPALVLLHGIGDSSASWSELIPTLAQDHLVIAPDLLGHGLSDKPRADYSIAAYANGLRDLLSVIGVERATIIGHSLGGGVAGQFAYQHPALVERLVLVSGGGAGREVSALLRLLSTPVAPEVLALLRLPFARVQVRALGALLRACGVDLGVDAPELLRVMDGFAGADGRAAFLRTLRAVVDWRGQVVSLLDRCYLAENVPTQIIWGDRDSVTPVSHAYRVHAAMPNSQLAVFEGAGHFPHRSDPVRFLNVVREFLATTEPARFNATAWRRQLRDGRSLAGLELYPTLVDPLSVAGERSAT